jgi:predicted DNA-binding protein (MmcQ/YjbR family)
MNVEDIREYCISKDFVTESTPFDEVTLVFKVGGKMFALLPLDEIQLSVNLKCDPEKAVALRELYPAVTPGYHMNKSHWNTVFIDGTIDKKLILQWIDDSYQLVLNSLPRKTRDSLGII